MNRNTTVLYRVELDETYLLFSQYIGRADHEQEPRGNP